MRTLVIASMGEAAGKTAFAAALGVRWQGVGVHVAYLKLRFSPPEPSAEAGLDGAFVPKMLATAAGSARSSGAGIA